MGQTEKKEEAKVKKTSIHGNDKGSIIASSAVLALLAGMMLVTFNLYTIAYSSYATREEEKFLIEIESTNDETR